MKAEDPRGRAEFRVSLHGDGDLEALRGALLDVPAASDADLTRLIVDLGGEPSPGISVLAVAAPPDESSSGLLKGLRDAGATVVVAARADDREKAGEIARTWFDHEGGAHAIPVSDDGAGLDVAELRAVLLGAALEGVDASVAEARRAKRPYAAAIVAGAALAAAAEGLLPGAAAFVVATQAGAIASLSYLYTGKWMGRAQTLSLLPMFASEAAGGSLFLLAKSFLPPTGIADAAAAAVAATLTLAMLGSVAIVLERGYTLEQKEELRTAFKKLRARSAAERAEILRNRGRWRDKSFWSEIVHRLVFEN